MSERALWGAVPRTFAAVVVKLRFVVVLAWIAGAIAATIYLPALGEEAGPALGGLVADDSEAIAARQRSAELFELPLLSEVAVVQRDGEGLSQEAVSRVVERAAAVAEGEEAPMLFALPVLNSQRIFPASLEDGTTAITYLFFEPGTRIGDQRSTALRFAEEQAGRPEDGLVGVTGAIPARLEEANRIENALPTIEIATVVLIAIVLGLTYRSLAAPAVTLVSAGLAYLVAIRVLPTLGDLFDVGMPQEIEPLVVVLLLGIATDYAIFFLSGLRGRLGAGEPRLVAARRSTAQNLPIVLTAGLIVAAGALTLLAGQLEYFRALGPGLALTALTGLVAATTLVPALLAILGRAAFWPSTSFPAPPPEEPAPPSEPGLRDRERPPAPERLRLRERIALRATAKPIAAAIVVVAAGGLVAAATGLRDTNLGFTLIRGLPERSDVREAQEAAQRGFSPGILAPTELLVEQEGLGALREELVRLEVILGREEGVAGIVGPREEPAEIATDAVISGDGSAARMIVVLAEEPLGGEAIDRLEALDERMPQLLRQAGLENATHAFAGDTALAADTVSLTVSDLRRIALAALGVNLLFLVLFLRAIAAPLFLLASSVLALGATLGLTTYVFQGWLGYDDLTYYVPFAAAVLLVSLGSDYNVFVAGRVWEEGRRRPLREAIAVAVPRASKAITVAGIALAGSFALLAIVPLRAFRELGFALAVGVLIDAFVVRSLLVPALLSLFGEVSWWPGRRRRHAPEPAPADGALAP